MLINVLILVAIVGNSYLVLRSFRSLSRKLSQINSRLVKNEALTKLLSDTALRVESISNIQMLQLLSQSELKYHLAFTSHSARFETLSQFVEGIHAQILKPSRITLTLAKSDLENISVPLLEKLKQSGIEICQTEDLGPGKKLIPLLSTQDLPIIVVDDDLILAPDLTLQLMIQHSMYPKSIIASRAHLITRTETGDLLPYSQWKKQVTDYNGPQADLFATSGAGTLFPKNALHPDVLDTNLYRELAFYTDDLWWHIHARRNGTVVRRIPGLRELVFLPGSQEAALWNTGNKVRNDENISLLINRFGEFF